MKTPAKPQQKSYRKGSSLYFTAGLVFSMVLIVTAFEWKTYYLELNDGPIVLKNLTEVPVIDFVPVRLPSPPKPKLNPVLTEDGRETTSIVPDLTPPEFDEPEIPEGDLGPGLEGLFDKEKPTDEKTFMPDITEAAVPVKGYDAFYAYIYDRLKIPHHLLDQKIDAKIIVSFVVDTDGSLTDVQVLKGFDQKLEEQVVKLLEESPAWKPAWQQGRKVKMRLQLPVVIKVNTYN